MKNLYKFEAKLKTNIITGIFFANQSDVLESFGNEVTIDESDVTFKLEYDQFTIIAGRDEEVKQFISVFGEDFTVGYNPLLFKPDTNVIISNQIKCKICDNEIYSAYCHDFKSCKCGAVSVDGGQDYLRRVGSSYVDQAIVWKQSLIEVLESIICEVVSASTNDEAVNILKQSLTDKKLIILNGRDKEVQTKVLMGKLVGNLFKNKNAKTPFGLVCVFGRVLRDNGCSLKQLSFKS